MAGPGLSKDTIASGHLNHRGRIISIANKLFFRVALGFSVATFAWPVMAQQTARQGASRDSAIRRCTRMAYVHYRDESEQLFRADVYKACMVAAGYQP